MAKIGPSNNTFYIVVKGKLSLYTSQMVHQARVYPGLCTCSMKWLRVFLLPLEGMLIHPRFNPSIKFAVTHLYTWVKRGTVRVKCLAQEHNPISLARARIQTAQSRIECTNHEATVPPQYLKFMSLISFSCETKIFLLNISWSSMNTECHKFN